MPFARPFPNAAPALLLEVAMPPPAAVSAAAPPAVLYPALRNAASTSFLSFSDSTPSVLSCRSVSLPSAAGVLCVLYLWPSFSHISNLEKVNEVRFMYTFWATTTALARGIPDPASTLRKDCRSSLGLAEVMVLENKWSQCIGSDGLPV